MEATVTLEAICPAPALEPRAAPKSLRGQGRGDSERCARGVGRGGREPAGAFPLAKASRLTVPMGWAPASHKHATRQYTPLIPDQLNPVCELSFIRTKQLKMWANATQKARLKGDSGFSAVLKASLLPPC